MFTIISEKPLAFVFRILIFYPEDGGSRFCRILVHSYETTRHHIPVDRNLESDEFNEMVGISQLIRKLFM